MRKILLKTFLVLLFVMKINLNCIAFEVHGYVINNKADTTYGTIKLVQFNQVNGSYLIHGFDMESLNYKVSFKGIGKKSFKTFSPGTILGFGFNYKSVDFTYRRFSLKFHGVFQKERQRFRFLCLVHAGKVELYQNSILLYNSTNKYMNDPNTVYYDYYLFNTLNGLVKVCSNKQNKSICDLLRQFNFDEKFIGEIPETYGFTDIRLVYERYDTWLSLHPCR